MKLTEKILCSLAIIGTILIFISLPGGSMLTILGLGILSMIYCYFGFAFFNGIRARDMFKKSSYKDIKALRIVGAIAAGFTLSTIVVGILFKIMMWPGASVMLLASFMPLLILALIAVIKYSGNKDVYYKRIFYRTVIFGGFGLFLFILPAYTIMEIRYECCPEYVSAVKELDKNPDNPLLQQKVNEERKKMDRMEGKE